MSTAGSPEADVAARLREADLVRLVAAATGDGAAAAGLLAGALDAAEIGYQTSVVPLPEPGARTTSVDLTVALGRPSPVADLRLGDGVETASAAALGVARELDGVDERGVVLALAGVLAAGRDPEAAMPESVTDRLDRRPGVAVPVADTADGLAHSTLVHAPFSGSAEAVDERLDTLAETDGRSVASVVALCVAGDAAGVPSGSVAVERLLRPHVGGPFETAGGLADVLGALATERPGHAVAVALGADLDSLSAWRTHARRAHAAVREADTARYDGLFVARCDETPPVGTVARLLRDYRSPEPVVLVVAGGEAAVAATPAASVDVGSVVETVAEAVDGEGAGTPTRGRVRFEADPDALIPAARGAV